MSFLYDKTDSNTISLNDNVHIYNSNNCNFKLTKINKKFNHPMKFYEFLKIGWFFYKLSHLPYSNI